MKKIISFMVMICLLVASVCVMTGCDDGKKDAKAGLRYTKYSDNDYYTVIGFSAVKGEDGKYIDLEDGVLDIHKIVGDKVVGEISKEAFKGISVISKIIVPQTVEKIGEGAFSEMAGLKELVVPFIGKNANADAVIGGSQKAPDKSVDLERTMYYWFGTTEFDGGASVASKYNATATETMYYLPCGLKTLTINAKAGDEDAAVYEVPAYACYNNKILTTLNVVNVKKLGDYSFAECKKLAKYTNGGEEKAYVDIEVGKNAIECTSLELEKD